VVDVRAIDELARKLAGSLPDGLMALKTDAEHNFKAVLQSALTRMDLVSRQEFDVQAALLARTREKLAALEQRLAQLEKPAR
jgi:ubiquinone biosynthesis accessory factor UbiK